MDLLEEMGAKDIILKGNLFHELRNFKEFANSPNYSSGWRDGRVYLHEIVYPTKEIETHVE